MLQVLSQLRDDLGYRRISAGIARLEELRPRIESLSPNGRHSGVFLGLIAQWVDAGFDGPSLLECLLARFPSSARGDLPLHDYLHVRMAEGVIEMSREEYDRAIGHFRFVQSLENDAPGDPELLAIANFWTGRCLRKIGRYQEALPYIIRGEELALSCGYLPMAAITQVTQSWLAFQKGRLDDALDMLRRAWDALSQTDDYLNRGNIQSAHGRIARRQGRYEAAMGCFENALADYRAAGGGQPQMARALQNLAFVQRVRALQLQRELDRIAAARRSGASPCEPTTALRSHVEELRGLAAAHVSESLAIYGQHNHHKGIAGGQIIRGFLRLDAGDMESAASDAATAFQHGEEKRDYFVMARARTLQCIVEHGVFEEQIGDPARHRETAIVYAKEAVNFAGRTENRRLLARALVWQGLTYAAGPNPDLAAARDSCEQANRLLQPDATQQQYVWEELETLKALLVKASPIEPQLRAWSAGIVPDTSFQKLTEEFARLVIPKVWEREGKKISRVAEKLSISPKKVRRILQSVGELK